MNRFRSAILISFILVFSLTSFAREEKPQPLTHSESGDKWAEKTLHKLTLQEKVGQVFMVAGI